MIVGTPTVDANGVKYYPVTSAYQGSQQQIIRVLEPSNPVAGKPRRFLYVLPVDQGVKDLSSTWSDGLEELRLLDVPNRFNMTLISPSFNYEPWYGDDILDPTHRMESFIVNDLLPFGDSFAQGNDVPQHYLIGFSKSGNGVLFLILRHPDLFSAAAAWDSPAQLSDINAFSALPENFGTQANFNLYNIPSLVSNRAQPFQQHNRLWISGDQAAWTQDMITLNNQLTAASIQHTWVQGGVREHSWGSGWLDGAVTDLDANAQPPAQAVVRSNGQPGGTLPAGTTQITISLTTNRSATCRYATGAGVTYGAMTNTFSSTGGTSHSTLVLGLMDGGSYNYYVRCQDSTGIANFNDYVIAFSVAMANGNTAVSNFSGTEDPLSENGKWDRPGSWSSLKKNNGAYTTQTTGGARLVAPVTGADQYAEITYDQDPGSASWPGVMTRVQGTTNGSGYLAIAYAGQVQLYRTNDTGSLNFSSLASANANVGAAPRRLRLESQGATHRVYFNGVLMLSYTDSNNTYRTGQPGIAAAIFGGPTVKILTFTGGVLTSTGGGTGDTTPPVRSGGQPAGVLTAGTTQTTLSLTTNENATCRYATSAGVAYSAMPNTFSSTGGTSHSKLVTGLTNGSGYSYYVRCQDTTGNANPDDYAIAFSVGTTSSGGGTATSSFSGVEDPLSENGMWSTTGSWTALKKNNGAYTTQTTSGARLVTPVAGADQYAEITYDQDPGSASWPGVATRVQSSTNGSGYLAIAYAGQVRLYRTDDNGSLNFTQLASATASVGTAPRKLRLESQGTTHKVYFNGVLMLTYTDSKNTYAAGQPGIAAAIFGGPTVKILTFNGGALTGSGTGDTTPPVRSAGLPTGVLAAGTTQTTLSLTTNESATCRYATSAAVAYSAMTNTFSSTGSTSHSTLVTGLSNGGSYSYYVRCRDGAGNANSDDYKISFTVATASGNTTASSSFSGVEDPLSENGMWGTTGSWTSLKKNNGAYTTQTTSGARLVAPATGANQYAEITYDQDPGSSAWPGVMTRVQGATNGSGYLAIAYAGQVRLYRTDDNGSLNFIQLASANVNVGTAPRRLRLESQGTTHKVYFNGVLMLSYTDSSNAYSTGQPGISAAIFGGPTVKILSFNGGALAGN
jgi:hypothetical protein